MTVAPERPTREIHRAEIDGVPVFWAEGPEPFCGTLLFRTGFADETMPTSGITHLLEHVALWQFGGDQPYLYNGVVEPLTTRFYAEGRQDQVLDFLTRTARALADPPLDKLETERRILLTEEASSGGGPFALHHRLRFGVQSLGLAYFVDFGLRKIGAEDVRRWAAQRFIADNAALWLTGPPPPDFALGLTRGDRVPPPEPPLQPHPYPCFLAGDYPEVVLSCIAERGAAIAMAMRIAARRLQRRLRYEDGVSYDVQGDGDALTADLGFVFLWADTLPDHAPKAAEGMLQVLHDLAESGPTKDELREDVERFRSELEDPYSLAADLEDAAHRELFGREPKTVEEKLAEDEALRPNEVAEALRAALDTALMTAPTTVDAPEGFSPPNVEHGDDFRTGEVFKTSGGLLRRNGSRFVVGDGGFTWWDEDGDPLTIELDHLVGVARSPDGYVILYRDCGCSIELDAEAMKGGTAAAEAALRHVPPELIVDMER